MGPPFFSAKKNSALEQGGVCFLFSQEWPKLICSAQGGKTYTTDIYGVARPNLNQSYEGETHPKKPPTQIKTQFAQTIRDSLYKLSPLYPLKQAEKSQKSLRKLFVQTAFIWVGGFLGGSPSLDNQPAPRSHGAAEIKRL